MQDQNCDLTMEEQMERLEDVAEAYEALPEDASTFEILEAIADAIGEPFEVVHNRFMEIKERK